VVFEEVRQGIAVVDIPLEKVWTAAKEADPNSQDWEHIDDLSRRFPWRIRLRRGIATEASVTISASPSVDGESRLTMLIRIDLEPLSGEAVEAVRRFLTDAYVRDQITSLGAKWEGAYEGMLRRSLAEPGANAGQTL